MNWFEVEEAFKRVNIAIFPVGAVHAHDHLPVGVDCLSINEIAERVGKRTGIVVAPTLPFGWLPVYDDYPGSLCVSKEVFKRMVLEVCKGLIRSGAKKIIFLNGHGGNEDILDDVAITLLQEASVLCPTFNWYADLQSLAGYKKPKIEIEEGLSATRDLETSIVLAVNPGLIDLKKSRVARAKKIYGENLVPDWYKGFKFRGSSIRMYTTVRPLIEYGEVYSEATAAKGKKILDASVDFFVEFIEEFKRVPIPEITK